MGHMKHEPRELLTLGAMMFVIGVALSKSEDYAAFTPPCVAVGLGAIVLGAAQWWIRAQREHRRQ